MDSGVVTHDLELSGVPDVIFFNAALQRRYVTIGDPGVIDVFDTALLIRTAVILTEKGAHTIAFDARAHKIYAFLPESHRGAVFHDQRASG